MGDYSTRPPGGGGGGGGKTGKKPTPKGKGKGSGSGSGSGGSGGGGGGGGIKKTQDAAQVNALKKLLSSGFKKALNQKLANIGKLYGQQDKVLTDTYHAKSGDILKNKSDNEKSESDSSFHNLQNRARETSEILSQTAENGAGETDTLKSQLMAVRNWDANQADVNRSYFDTARSINSAVTDLNTDTMNARMNLAVQTQGDKEQAYGNYYNQKSEGYTQLGNIYANPYSASASKKKTKAAFDSMAKAASSVWKDPGVSSKITGWKPSLQQEEGRLNNVLQQNAAGVVEKKRPEGSTLREW